MYHFVNRESSIQSFYCLQLWTCGFVIARGGRAETVVPNQTQHFQQSSEFVFVRIIPSTPPSPTLPPSVIMLCFVSHLFVLP